MGFQARPGIRLEWGPVSSPATLAGAKWVNNCRSYVIACPWGNVGQRASCESPQNFLTIIRSVYSGVGFCVNGASRLACYALLR